MWEWKVASPEEQIKERMLSILASQERNGHLMPRNLQLRNHYVGWKDPNGTTHVEPHPDDCYLPLNLWGSVE